MHMFKRMAAVVTLMAAALHATAQSEGGMVLSAEAEKKIDKNLSVNVEADLRTRNDFKTLDRWSIGIGASYKLTSWLKADAGYILLDQNNREKITYEDDGDYNHLRPSYWSIKHRVYAGLTGSYKFSNGIKLSLRERWQYT